mmetsp:Transcript_9235/g.24854  ORF Transcript_9235/g.24854 Transcript_9235/m.24854 type:complete len:211 (+) Transcript_9235:1239-1871(+)|eukprot:CAMPEP_0202339026 /NCGR_PEP_ID=MMETSP1126-20121109/1062_1 /ASSEMBLY_ACC=CAM_ASM_000457 /TAXON_ID=3047 /ORGANISM="Dunaliella tertiolecta, Strain CCMP1320" /LENGTH=210 /DNA_ID=CAMNT_0048929513 /DNA_START=44 /DNA_END=676 /DNA_ORIENTATION=+
MDDQVFVDASGTKRLKETELVVPIIVGTVAFSLGKKASESSSHRWTVYLRGPNNEDLSYLVSQVRFDLHQTFQNPQRIVESQPFEVTEHGWGEFDIIVHVYFTLDSGVREAILYHKLRLYEDGEQPGCKQDPKKPVVTETFEELVFSEPRVDFYQRITHHQPSLLLPPSQLAPYFPTTNPTLELDMIHRSRMKVASMVRDLALSSGLAAQ